MTKLKHIGVLIISAIFVALFTANPEAFSETVPYAENSASFSDIALTQAKADSTSRVINQDTPFEIQCPEDISTYTDLNECSAEISDLNLQYSGGTLSKLTWAMTGATVDASSASGINQINNYVFDEGITFITYTATDQQGNTLNCSFSVTVIDNESPVIIAPKNLFIHCDERIPSPHTTLQAFFNAGGFATDNCDLLANSFQLSNEVKDNKNCPYILTRTYRISDIHGNASIAKQLIIVSDEDSLFSKTGTSISGASANISYTKANVLCRDDNNGAIHLILSGTSGSVTFIWTTINGSGIIQGQKDQTSLTDGDYNVKIYENGVFLMDLDISILVADDEVPVLYAPDDITLDCNRNVPPAYRTWSQFENAGGSATDNCQLNYATFRLFSETQTNPVCPFTVTRIYQISDANGNIGKVEHHIIVEDKEVVNVPLLKSGMSDCTASTGNWNDITTWDCGKIPDVGDNVIIPNGVTVTVNAAAVCNNITIETGGTIAI